MPLQPAAWDIQFEQGASWTDQIGVYSDPSMATPMSWTGLSVGLRVRNSAGTLLLDWNTTNTKITLPKSGVIQMVVQGSDTQSVSPGTYAYELIAYSASAGIPLMAGTFTLTVPTSKYWSTT